MLIPDGASPSTDVWRARWNPQSKLFEADPDTDVVLMSADAGETRPRPTAASIAPDGDAYVVFQRSSSIQRIVEPDGATPHVELVGFTSDGVGTAAIAAGYGPLGPLGPPTVYVGEGAGIRQIAGVRGDATTTTAASPLSAGAAVVGTLAYRATDTTSGQGTLYAGTAEAAAPLVLPGPDRVLRLRANAAPAPVAGGFSTVGGPRGPSRRRLAVRVRRPGARDRRRAARARTRVHPRRAVQGEARSARPPTRRCASSGA